MLVWRLVKVRHGAAPLAGEGARRFGGRWNHKGTRMVYAAGSQSLAILECLVHLELSEAPADLQAIALEIPDALARRVLAPGDLPPDWRAIPGPESLKALGTLWARDAREAVLVVPSAIIPEEVNVLLNPDHPDFALLTARPPVPFAFDPRLYPPPVRTPK